MRLIYFTVIISICYISCNKNIEKSIVIDLESSTKNSFCSIVDSSSYITLSSLGYEKILGVSKIYFVDSQSFVLFDKKSQQVLHFNNSGKFLKCLFKGSTEKNPSLRIEDIAFDDLKNNILIFQPELRELTYINIASYTSRKVKFENTLISGLNFESFNNALIFDRVGYNIQGDFSKGALFDGDSLSYSHSFLKIPSYFVGYGVELKKVFDQYNKVLYYLPPFLDTLYSFPKQNEVYPIPFISIDFKKGTWANKKHLDGRKPTSTNDVYNHLQSQKLTEKFDRLTIVNGIIYFSFYNNKIQYDAFYCMETGNTKVIESINNKNDCFSKTTNVLYSNIISKYKNDFVGYIFSDSSCIIGFYKIRQF